LSNILLAHNFVLDLNRWTTAIQRPTIVFPVSIEAPRDSETSIRYLVLRQPRRRPWLFPWPNAMYSGQAPETSAVHRNLERKAVVQKEKASRKGAKTQRMRKVFSLRYLCPAVAGSLRESFCFL
jgi:hypothetical protein